MTCCEGMYLYIDNMESKAYCKFCDKSCKSCIDESPKSCLECKPGLKPFNTNNNSTVMCKACEQYNPGYYTGPDGKCIETCGDGLNLGQHQCDDGNTYDNDGCNSECKVEYGYSCHSTGGPDVCVDILPPRAVLKISKGNKLYVVFSEPVRIHMNSTELAKTMKVSLEGISSQCEFNWALNETFKQNAIVPQLEILGLPKCSLKENAALYIVEFIQPKMITDTTDNSLATPILTVRSKRSVYISAGEKVVVDAAGTAFDSSSLLTFVFLLGFSVFQSIAMGSFWAFINMLQMISYLPIIDCMLPYNFETLLNEYLTIKRVSIPLKMMPDFIYNPLALFAAFLTKPFNSRFVMSGYDSLSFIFNFSEELFTWICVAFLYLALTILTRIIPDDKYFFTNFTISLKRCLWIHKMKKDYEYNGILRILIECYLNMNFCAILNIWNVFF